MADDLMLTLTGTDWLGVALAVVAAQFLGWLWFGPLFGRAWAREMGFDASKGVDGKTMARSLLLFLLGNVFMAYVLWHEIHGWLPTLWAANLGVDPATVEDSSVYAYGGFAALFNWLGFMVPLHLGRIAWEQKGWRLFGINAGFDIVRLAIMAIVIATLSGQV